MGREGVASFPDWMKPILYHRENTDPARPAGIMGFGGELFDFREADVRSENPHVVSQIKDTGHREGHSFAFTVTPASRPPPPHPPTPPSVPSPVGLESAALGVIE